MDAAEPLQPIDSAELLEQLLAAGYQVKGPRNDPQRDRAGLQRMIEKGYVYSPESWLAANGYKFVEPSSFTKGHRIAYKIIDDFPDERFDSPYSLVKDGKEIPLYLKTELPKLS